MCNQTYKYTPSIRAQTYKYTPSIRALHVPKTYLTTLTLNFMIYVAIIATNLLIMIAPVRAFPMCVIYYSPKCMDDKWKYHWYLSQQGYSTSIHTDIDECALGISGCNQICTNTNGSYVCSCYLGYQISSNNKICVGKLCHFLCSDM